MGLVFDRWTAGTPLRPLGTPDCVTGFSISPWRWVQVGPAVGPSWGNWGAEQSGAMEDDPLLFGGQGALGGQAGPLLYGMAVVCVCFAFSIE